LASETRLEILYPLFKEQIQLGLSKGYGEPEIETRIHKYINNLRDQGYPDEEIVKHIQPLAGESRPQVGESLGETWSFIKQVAQDVPGAIRNAVRGFNESATLGYASVPPLEEAATPGQQAGRAVGEFAGGAAPFVKGMQALKAGRTALGLGGGTGAVSKAAGMATDIMGSVAGTAALSNPGEGGSRLENVQHAVTDPYALAGAAFGGAAAGLGVARAAAAQRAMERFGTKKALQEGESVQQALSARMEATEAQVVEQTPRQADVELKVAGEYVPSKWSNETLMDEYSKTVARGEEHRPEVATEVARRSVQDRRFRDELTTSILSAKRAVEESKRATERTGGTVGAKVSKEAVSEQRKLGEVNLKDMTPDELNSAAQEISRKMQLYEQKQARPTRTGTAEYNRLGEVQKKIEAELATRQESSVGAQEYSGDVNLPPHVQRAITGFEKMIMLGGPLSKETLPTAIAELRANHRLSDATAKKLGIERKKVAPDPGPMTEAEAPPVPESITKPRESITKPAINVTVAAEESPASPAMVNVYKGGQLTNSYKLANLAEAESMSTLIRDAVSQSTSPELYRVEIAPPAGFEKTAEVRPGRARKLVGDEELKGVTGRKKGQPAEPLGEAVPDAISESHAVQEGLTIRGGRAVKPPPASPAYTLSSLKLLADAKGVALETDMSQGLLMRMTMHDGQVHQSASLKEATEFLLRSPDRASRGTIDKALDGKELTREDRQEINRFSADKLAVEPRETEAPILNTNEPSAMPTIPPISGGAGGALATDQFLLHVAAKRGMGPAKASDFLNGMLKIFAEHPHMEAWYRNEMAGSMKSGGRAAFINPADYLPHAMPQFSSNPGIRTITQDAAYKHGLPKAYEYKQWVDFYNKHLAPLTEKEDRAAWLVTRGRQGEKLTPAAQQGLEAFKAFTDDVAQRLGVGSTWHRYLSGIIDHQSVYSGWRKVITAYSKFSDLPLDLKERFGGNPDNFEMTRKAFERNEKYADLPRTVKGILDNDLTVWFDAARHDQLPQYIKDMVPDEMWRRFSMTGNGNLVESMKTTFKNILPVVLDEMYTKPWEAKWKPMWDTLPGGITGMTTKAYLHQWWDHVRGGAERSGISRALDDQIARVEEYRGKMLAKPDVLDRLAKAVGRNVYRSTLGFALDTMTLNLTQSINTWAESGRVTSGILARLTSSERAAMKKAIPGDVNIMEEFAWHTMHKTGAELEHQWGLPKGKIKQIGEKLNEYSMSPMHLAENVNRGIALMAGLDTALAQGLDAQTALLIGTKRASQVVNNLKLTAAQVEGIKFVSKTQYSYGPEFQNPWFQGPLAKASTLFVSYPVKTLQFLTNGMGSAAYDMITSGGGEGKARFTRYAAVTGLFLSGPILAQKSGLINLENAFSPQSLFPRLASITLQPLMTMYNMVLGRDPISGRDWDQMWKNFIHMLGVPGLRYSQKLVEVAGRPGLTESGWVDGNMQRGFSINKYGQAMYESTPFGEFMRLFGIESGRTYQERNIARMIIQNQAIMDEQRKQALKAALEGDTSKIDAFNEEWGEYGPGLALTGEDVVNWAQRGQLKAVDRFGSQGMRIGVQQETGYTP